MEIVGLYIGITTHGWCSHLSDMALKDAASEGEILTGTSICRGYDLSWVTDWTDERTYYGKPLCSWCLEKYHQRLDAAIKTVDPRLNLVILGQLFLTGQLVIAASSRSAQELLQFPTDRKSANGG